MGLELIYGAYMQGGTKLKGISQCALRPFLSKLDHIRYNFRKNLRNSKPLNFRSCLIGAYVSYNIPSNLHIAFRCPCDVGLIPNTHAKKPSLGSTNHHTQPFQGSDLWKDKDRFIKFAQASLELCRVYVQISSSTNSQRELYAAEMHLKNTVKQAR